MMSEMDATQSRQGRQGSSYGGYEEQPRVSAQSGPPYEMGYQPPPFGGAIDDNFVEAVSQRIAQQVIRQSQQSSGKVYGQKHSPELLPAGLRGAIAIVSVSALIPLGIVLGVNGQFLALGIVSAVILLVNAIVNGVFSFRD